MRYALAIVVLSAMAAAPASADPQIQTSGNESFPGKNELSAHIGYASGLGGQFANPSGFKLSGEYAHGLSEVVWLDFQFNNTFGFGVASGTCFDRGGNPFPCGRDNFYYGGSSVELAAGVKLKLKTGIPLVIEVPLVVAVEILYGRQCNDGGFGLVAKPGVGVKYFITRNIGLGGGINFAFGPNFHPASNCFGSYTDTYVAADFQIGAEFIF